MPATPKKRGQKPKHVAAGDQPSQNTTEVTVPKAAGKSTVDTVIDPKPKLKKKAPLPAHDPLPAREGRNTHPGLHIGIQPTPRRSAQAVAAERKKKRQALEAKQHALEAKLQGIEEAKDVLAQMELEDESLKEEVEEQGRRRLPNPFAPYHKSSGDEEFEGWDNMEDIADDDIEDDIVDDDLEPEPEVVELVKTYFEAAMFIDQSKEIKRHAWWALRPNGLAYNAKPTPIGCAFEPKSPHYIHPQGRYQSAVIVPITKKFLALANGSAILLTISAQNPPIGLYILILTAVKCAYKSFITGTYKLPTQFSNENVWCTMDEYCKCLLQLSAGQWAQILDSLGLQDYSERYADLTDAEDLSKLSAYWGGLMMGFASPVKCANF
ncbi:hypothetical protein EI94DRAFT_1819402 [Lactarius quietus]|nr:hypothetical protein EI94DRAFT_1819402 [Lactarius quietus]